MTRPGHVMHLPEPVPYEEAWGLQRSVAALAGLAAAQLATLRT